MNLGGIKISSAEIERVLNGIDIVQETAAVAVANEQGPDQLVVFAVITGPIEKEALLKLMNQQIKQQLNPLFRVAQVELVASLPRTASNKVMRRKLRDLLATN